MEPALTAGLARACVPRDAERLQSAPGHRDEVLLERIDPEGEPDFVVMHRALGPVRPHHELVLPSRERRGDATVREFRIVEIAKDASLGGRLHRQLMMRSQPAFEFSLVAARTSLRPDESRSTRGCGRRRRGTASIASLPPMNRNRRDRDDRQSGDIDRPGFATRLGLRWKRSNALAVCTPSFPLRHEVRSYRRRPHNATAARSLRRCSPDAMGCASPSTNDGYIT